jgi:hypothetical protein
MALVNGECALQRCLLLGLLPLLPVSPGQVHPQLGGMRISRDGPAEQRHGLAVLAFAQHRQAQHVQGDGMLTDPRDQILEQRRRCGRAVAAARLARGCEGSLNLCFVHGRSISKSDRIDKPAAGPAETGVPPLQASSRTSSASRERDCRPACRPGGSCRNRTR